MTRRLLLTHLLLTMVTLVLLEVPFAATYSHDRWHRLEMDARAQVDESGCTPKQISITAWRFTSMISWPPPRGVRECTCSSWTATGWCCG